MKWIKERSVGSLLVLLALAVGLVYVNSLPNGFVWDDEEQIVGNVQIQQGRVLENLGEGTFYSGGSGELSGWFWRPAVVFLYSFLYKIFGLQEWGFHLFQVLLHIGAVGLGFLVLSKLWKREWAFLAALILAVHPVGVEAVGYVAALGDVVVLTGVMLALWVVLRKEEYKTADWLLIGVGLFLALLAKESAVIGLMVVLAGWLWRREKINTLIGVVGLVAVLYLSLRVVVGVRIGGAAESLIGEASLGERMLSVFAIWMHYIKTFVFPLRLSISQHWMVREWVDVRFWGNVLALLGLAGAVIWMSRKGKRLVFFAGWMVMGLLLVSQIIPLEMTVADRWMYLPMWGMMGVAGEVGAAVVKEKEVRRVVWWLGVLVAFVFGVRSWVRLADWRSGLRLYSYDVKLSGESFELHNNLGVELVRDGRLDEAEESFKESLSIKSDYRFALNNLGVVYQRQGKIEKARVMYEKCLEVSDYWRAWENLAWLRLKSGEVGQMREWIEEGVGKLPGNDDLRMVYAVVLYRQGEAEEALGQARIGVSIENSERNVMIWQMIKNGEEIDI